MRKIKITKMATELHLQRGFDEKGCYGCQCNDLCCTEGADVDKEVYELIKKYREQIEHISTIAFEDFFENTWSGETDFLGGDSIRSRVGATGYCIFHFPEQKGCILFKLSFHDGLPKRIIPSICRLFPLTWNNETIEFYKKENVPAQCNCLALKNKAKKSIIETQQEAVEDIFDIII